MSLAKAIGRGRRGEALALLAAAPSGLERDLAALQVALWFEPEPRIRRATLALRTRLLGTLDPAWAARCWLGVAHALAATDPKSAGDVAEEALERCREGLPARADEARTLASLLGRREPPLGAPDAVHGRVLHAAACLAHATREQAAARASALLETLNGVPAACRAHAERWAGIAENAAGLERQGPRDGVPVVFDTLEATVTVGEHAPVRFARSRRRFDLLLAVALYPGLARESLFERVWGHAWHGAPSKNALHAAVSRTRKAVPGLDLEADDSGRYALAGAPTIYVRGPVPSMEVAAGEGTALVGRAAQLRSLREALVPGAWVGLWGPPGSGKSRLAREVARTWGSRVLFVELRGVDTRDRVVDAVARRLGGEAADLAFALRVRPDTLVVLDDLDDLDAVDLGDLLAAWRHGDSTVRLLTTHRHRREADHALLVPPLSPQQGGEMIAQMARGVGADEARELARRLDGLPLALELAGRHLARLSVGDLLDVLPAAIAGDEGPVGTAIRVSWDGLPLAGRRALTRLAVVDVALPRAAAEAILDEEDHAWIGDLAGRALVQDLGDTVVLLRAVRRFAVRHLDEADRRAAASALVRWGMSVPTEDLGAMAPVLVATHREACVLDPEAAVTLTLAVARRMQGATAPSVPLAMVEQALAVAPDDRRDALRTVEAAVLYGANESERARAVLDEVQPRLSGEYEAIALLVRARLARSGRAPDADVALDAAVERCTGDDLREALTVRGFHRVMTWRIDAAKEDLERAIEVAEVLGPAAAARARANRGLCATIEGHLLEAERLFSDAVEELDALGQLRIVRHNLHNLALVLHRLGRLDEADEVAMRALALHEELGQPVRAASTRLGLASIALDRGDLELALRRAYRAVSDGRGHEMVSWVVREAGAVAAAAHWELGQYTAALALLEEGTDSILTQVMRALFAAQEGDLGGVDDALEIAHDQLRREVTGTLDGAGLFAVWGALRHLLGGPGAAECVRRARASLGRDEQTMTRAVEAAEHVVLGAPLRDAVPPSHLARALLTWTR